MSDTEFEKFLQQSLSSSASHSSLLSRSGIAADKVGDVFCQQSEELNDLELEATGSFWLKSTGQVCQSSVQMTLPSKEEFAKDSLDALTNTEGKTTKSSLSHISVSSSIDYAASRDIESSRTDIVSQTGDKNDSHKPGPDTLEENADKNIFFAELEEGRAISIDYSELNKGLIESRRASVLDNIFNLSASDDELPSQYNDDFESLSLLSSNPSKMVTSVESKADLSLGTDGNSESKKRTQLDLVLECLAPDTEIFKPSKRFLLSEDSRDIPLASSNLGSLRSTAEVEVKARTNEIAAASLSNTDNTSIDKVGSGASGRDINAKMELGKELVTSHELEIQSNCQVSSLASLEALDKYIDILSPSTASVTRSSSIDGSKSPTEKSPGPCHVPLSANTLELSLPIDSLTLVADESPMTELDGDLAELQSALSAAGLPQIGKSVPGNCPISANGVQVGEKSDGSSELAKPLPSHFSLNGSTYDKIDLQEVIRTIASEELASTSKYLLEGDLLSPSTSFCTRHSLSKPNVTAMSGKQSDDNLRPSRIIMESQNESASSRRKSLISQSSLKQSGFSKKQVSTSAYRCKAKLKDSGSQRSIPFRHKLASKPTQPVRNPAAGHLQPERHEVRRPPPSSVLTQRLGAMAIKREKSGHVTKCDKVAYSESRSESAVELVSKQEKTAVQLPRTTTSEVSTTMETDGAGLVRTLELKFLHREDEIRSRHSEEIAKLNQKHSIQVKELEMALESRELPCKNDSNFSKKNEALQGEVKEQEELILGYQKENERLYAELTSQRKESKASDPHQQEYQRMARELVVTKDQLEEQLCQHLSQETVKSSRLTQLEQMLEKEGGERKQLQQQLKQLQDGVQSRDQELTSMKHQNKSLQLIMDDSISKQALQQLTLRHMEEISSLMKKSDKLEKTHKHLEHISEILRSSEAEVASLKEKLTSLESQKSNKISLQRPKNQANNPKRVQRVQQLEKQVKDLEKVIQKRFPNSLAALITAANCPDQDASAESVLHEEELKSEVKELRKTLEVTEAKSARKYEALHLEYSLLKSKHAKQASLIEHAPLYLHPPAPEDTALATAETSQPPQTGTLPCSHAQAKTLGKEFPVRLRTHTKSDGRQDVVQKDADNGSITPTSDKWMSFPQVSALVVENKKLKEELSQLNFELAHQKVQLQGRLAEAERKATVSDEEAQKRVTQLEAGNQQRLDSLVEKSHSEVTELKFQLIAREATIVHLREKMVCLEYDSRQVSACKAREEELTQQVKNLSEEVVEAQRHHTPEMHHVVMLQAKISILEERCKDLVERRRGQGQHSSSGTSSMDIEHKWRRQVVAKNAEIEEYREELDSLLAALRVLQHRT